MNITEYVLSHRERALLIGDHGAYRAQLSRQLRTLRRQLGRATPKNGQFSSKPIVAEDIAKNVGFAHVLLLSAERAWAHAIHMKTSHVEDSSAKKVPGSRRSHVVSRLTKAAKQAGALLSTLEASESYATQGDWLEAKAYTSYLLGLAELEKHAAAPKAADRNAQRDKWQTCLEHLSVARVIYSAFYKKTKKEYFKDIVSTSIDPSMRFASYQAQIPRTVPVTAVARKYFPDDEAKLVSALKAVDANALDEADTQSGDSALPTTISWRGRTAKIGDATISQALVDVSNAEKALQDGTASGATGTASARAAAYDEVLIASQDAVDATRHAIEEHEKEKIPESDSRMQDLRVTSIAVNYDMISWRVGRNRVLIGPNDGIELEALPPRPARSKTQKQTTPKPEGRGRKLARLRERVVLYDAILQSIDSIKELRGAARDEKFIHELDGKRAYFQALKCLNIAYSHALLGHYTNTLALVARAHTLASTAHDSAVPAAKDHHTAPLRLDINAASSHALITHLAALTHRYTGLVDLQRASASATSSTAPGTGTATGSGSGTGDKHAQVRQPLVQKLHEFPAAGAADLANLVTYPPKLQPVPVKPLFLDLAWNYIEYPDSEGAAVASVTSAKVVIGGGGGGEKGAVEEKPKKGWFGFGR